MLKEAIVILLVIVFVFILYYYKKQKCVKVDEIMKQNLKPVILSSEDLQQMFRKLKFGGNQ